MKDFCHCGCRVVISREDITLLESISQKFEQDNDGILEDIHKLAQDSGDFFLHKNEDGYAPYCEIKCEIIPQKQTQTTNVVQSITPDAPKQFDGFAESASLGEDDSDSEIFRVKRRIVHKADRNIHSLSKANARFTEYQV